MTTQDQGDGRGGMFRKKPVVIAAVQWTGVGNPFGYYVDGRYHNRRLGVDDFGVEHTVQDCGVRTLEGFMRVSEGDWIITGVKGERYPCKPDIFAATYERAESRAQEGVPSVADASRVDRRLLDVPMDAPLRAAKQSAQEGGEYRLRKDGKPPAERQRSWHRCRFGSIMPWPAAECAGHGPKDNAVDFDGVLALEAAEHRLQRIDDEWPDSVYRAAIKALEPYVESLPLECASGCGRTDIGTTDDGGEYCQRCADDGGSGELGSIHADTVAIEVINAIRAALGEPPKQSERGGSEVGRLATALRRISKEAWSPAAEFDPHLVEIGKIAKAALAAVGEGRAK